jgi:hypothetical protein
LHATDCAAAVLARPLKTLERKYDAQFKAMFDTIRQLIPPPFTRCGVLD